MSKITVLVVEPQKRPYIKEIDDSIESLQNEVSGWIEIVYPFEDEVGLICNEEGKINELPLNRALVDNEGEVIDIISGTFLIAGLTEDNIGSLSPELIQKFSERFKFPEFFLRGKDGKVLVVHC